MLTKFIKVIFNQKTRVIITLLIGMFNVMCKLFSYFRTRIQDVCFLCLCMDCLDFILIFKNILLNLFLERGEGDRERGRGRGGERERDTDVRGNQFVASPGNLTGDLTCDSSMCPDWGRTGNLLLCARTLRVTPVRAILMFH